jgi:hypothetical protein
MIQSILVAKLVYNFLKSNTELNNYIDGRVFPIVAELGTEFPYVAYSRTHITPTYTKDYHTEDSVGVDIVVASQDYLESLEIANIIRKQFECKRLGLDDEITISQSNLLGVTEAYDDQANAYIQSLSFDFKVR